MFALLTTALAPFVPSVRPVRERTQWSYGHNIEIPKTRSEPLGAVGPVSVTCR